MADLKISQLSSATALAGTETTPVVQSGSTKKATVDQILTPAAGKGIDYSQNTPTAGATSQILDWYEEGTFTPVINQGFTAPVSYTSQVGKYTRIGDLVYFHIYIYLDAGQTPNTDALGVSGLPYAAASGIINGCTWGYASGVVVAGTALPNLYLGGSGGLFYNTGGAPFTGLNLSSARPEIAISGVYKAA